MRWCWPSWGHSSPLALNLYQRGSQVRLKTYATDKITLSDAIPVMEGNGCPRAGRMPHPLASTRPLAARLGAGICTARRSARPQTPLRGPVSGRVAAAGRKRPPLNRLVLTTTLDARATAVLRAHVRYFKVLGFAFSQSYIEDTLNHNPGMAQMLSELFALRFDPALAGDRAAQVAAKVADIEAALAEVSSLEQDRVLRQCSAPSRSRCAPTCTSPARR